MGKGEDALELLKQDLDSCIKRKQRSHPDFEKCGMGADWAETEHTSSLLVLRCMRVQLDAHDKNGNGKMRVGPVQLSGWGAVATALGYLLMKAHNLL